MSPRDLRYDNLNGSPIEETSLHEERFSASLDASDEYNQIEPDLVTLCLDSELKETAVIDSESLHLGYSEAELSEEFSEEVARPDRDGNFRAYAPSDMEVPNQIFGRNVPTDWVKWLSDLNRFEKGPFLKLSHRWDPSRDPWLATLAKEHGFSNLEKPMSYSGTGIGWYYELLSRRIRRLQVNPVVRVLGVLSQYYGSPAIPADWTVRVGKARVRLRAFTGITPDWLGW
jgi:hypothetical protein